MVIKPAVSSILSKHTAQVGISIKLGVGGGKGLSEFTTPIEDEAGIFPLCLTSWDIRPGVSIVIDFMKVTWHISP